MTTNVSGREIGEEFFSEILRPDFNFRKNELLKQGTKLVHYTSAEAALKIIRNKSVWLRQTKLMNDYSEVEYGISKLLDNYNSPSTNKKFAEFFSYFGAETQKEFEDSFNKQLNILRFNSYILSLAEHDDTEDNFGRLSMWRAYGRSCLLYTSPSPRD